MPIFKNLESGKYYNTGKNYRLYMGMIFEFRHIITHQQGGHTSVEDVYQKMKENLEKYNQKYIGDLTDDFKNEIEFYFDKNCFERMICLSEIEHNEYNKSDRLGTLIGIIVSYVEILCQQFKREVYFFQNPEIVY